MGAASNGSGFFRGFRFLGVAGFGRCRSITRLDLRLPLVGLLIPCLLLSGPLPAAHQKTEQHQADRRPREEIAQPLREA